MFYFILLYAIAIHNFLLSFYSRLYQMRLSTDYYTSMYDIRSGSVLYFLSMLIDCEWMCPRIIRLYWTNQFVVSQLADCRR